MAPVQPYASQSCAQANQSLDTVRTLHHTVVSLRNALDDARREISNLKKQINVQTVIDEGKAFKQEQDQGSRPLEEGSSGGGGGQKLGSQIDVKIRVSSNLNVSTGETMEEGGGASDPDSKRSVVNIKLTSQENLNVSHQEENVYSYNQSTNEDVCVGAKDRPESLAEEESQEAVILEEGDEETDGDNSVFDDSKVEEEDDGEEQEEGIRTRNVLQLPHQKLIRAHSDTQEEVDDIELIFSSDADHKELHEEEMVSISAAYEPWQKPGASGTPVLLSFERFSLEEHEDGQQTTKESLSKRQMSLDGEGSKNPKSFMKKASLDCDTAVSTRPTLGCSQWQRNRNDLHVTDISKCGISEENIKEMGRRNTCPNPPVYRPILRDSGYSPGMIPAQRHRNSLSATRCILGGKYTRPSRGSYQISSPAPFSARSILRSPLIAITDAANCNESTQPKMIGPKRSSSVQTEISALPDHWQSESHLSGSGFGNGLFTLPSKFNPVLTGGGGHGPRPTLR